MSRKQKQRTKQSSPPGEPLDDPATAVLPTVWMLAVVVTLVAEVVSLIGAVLASRSDNMQLAMLTAAAMFASAIGGLIALALTALVIRVLKPPPPKSLVATAIIVGAIPWVVLAVQLLTR